MTSRCFGAWLVFAAAVICVGKAQNNCFGGSFTCDTSGWNTYCRRKTTCNDCTDNYVASSYPGSTFYPGTPTEVYCGWCGASSACVPGLLWGPVASNSCSGSWVWALTVNPPGCYVAPSPSSSPTSTATVSGTPSTSWTSTATQTATSTSTSTSTGTSTSTSTRTSTATSTSTSTGTSTATSTGTATSTRDSTSTATSASTSTRTSISASSASSTSTSAATRTTTAAASASRGSSATPTSSSSARVSATPSVSTNATAALVAPAAAGGGGNGQLIGEIIGFIVGALAAVLAVFTVRRWCMLQQQVISNRKPPDQLRGPQPVLVPLPAPGPIVSNIDINLNRKGTGVYNDNLKGGAVNFNAVAPTAPYVGPVNLNQRVSAGDQQQAARRPALTVRGVEQR